MVLSRCLDQITSFSTVVIALPRNVLIVEESPSRSPHATTPVRTKEDSFHGRFSRPFKMATSSPRVSQNLSVLLLPPTQLRAGPCCFLQVLLEYGLRYRRRRPGCPATPLAPSSLSLSPQGPKASTMATSVLLVRGSGLRAVLLLSDYSKSSFIRYISVAAMSQCYF